MHQMYILVHTVHIYICVVLQPTVYEWIYIEMSLFSPNISYFCVIETLCAGALKNSIPWDGSSYFPHYMRHTQQKIKKRNEKLHVWKVKCNRRSEKVDYFLATVATVAVWSVELVNAKSFLSFAWQKRI